MSNSVDVENNSINQNNSNQNVRQRYFENLTLSETVESVKDDAGRTLKTFTGVFCPVALAQFSTLLFLRTGFVVGQSGLIWTLVQLVLAYTMLTLTILSICAISTNGAVKGGGVYFMISRTLGPEIGGSIGIMFYWGNIFSSALYISGFVEGIQNNFGPDGYFSQVLPDGPWWRYLFATAVCLFCLAVCMIGSSMFAKTSLVIFIIVVTCLLSVVVSFLFKGPMSVPIPRDNSLIYYNTSLPTQNASYTGLSAKTFKNNVLYDSYAKDYTQHKKMDFLTVFAVLFAGVTGIMNGANMSGELKNPGKSIPTGTIAATIFTATCYVLISFLASATCDRKLLVNSYLYMQFINYWPPFVLIGIFATTLSAALGNLIGASRILLALANDDLFGIFLKPMKIIIRGNNPIVSVVVSYIFVQVVLLMGQVNRIAPAVSVFFLLAYASVNLACALLDLASASNFRPQFKYFNWFTSILGMLGCTVMCFLIQFQYAIGLLLLFFVIIVILSFRHLQHAWGNIGQALIYHQVRKYLLLLDNRKDHVKYWRPQILLLISNPRSQCTLIKFVNLLKKGGLFVLGHVVKGNFETMETDPCNNRHRLFMEVKDCLKVKAFVDVTVSNTVREGCRHLVRLSGLGGMTPNTICMGFWDTFVPKDVLLHVEEYNKSKSRFWPFTRRKTLGKSKQIDKEPKQTSVVPQMGYDQIFSDVESSRDILPVVMNENSPLVENEKMKSLKKSSNDSKKKKTQFLEELPQVRQQIEMASNSSNQMTRCNSSEAILEPSLIKTEEKRSESEFQTGLQISRDDYLGIIEDCIKMRKNICLARHFNEANLFVNITSTKLNSKPRYIDVWPINFFQPGSGSYIDDSCKLMLQLACILRMSSNHGDSWRVRVFICLDYYSATNNCSTSANNNEENNGETTEPEVNYKVPNSSGDTTEMGDKKLGGRYDVELLWNTLLKQWRIPAEIHLVQWDDILMNLESERGRQLFTSTLDSNIGLNKRTMSLFQSHLPKTYIEQVNLLIRSHSTHSQSAVCLLYLPIPPAPSPTTSNEYLSQLTLISEELPPSLFVCGQQEVMTVAI